jgi:NAD(P)-dependent dehydrogenase (short-subunit alcohol dehydrogenase family)
VARKCVFVTDLRGFANAEIASRLAASANVVACDPGIAADGDEGGIPVLGWDEPRTLVARAVERFGGQLDAIFIAPAMPAPRTPADELTVEQLMPFYQRLAAEALVFASAAAKAMRPHKAGRIVFCTSATPMGGGPGFVAYVTARSAVNGAVRTLALELARDGISVNAIAPNYVQTETYYPKALLEDPVKGPKLLSRIPLGRLGRASEVAAMAELLTLGDSGFVSGQVIEMSGGWS